MNIGTLLLTWLSGARVGTDAQGNEYYQERRPAPAGRRRRRWVLYRQGPVEASRVPPEWHSWLHYTTAAPLAAAPRVWVKPHQPNLTGTSEGYRPPGHDYAGGRRPPATGDYESWTPGS